jgi:phage tail-like protein
MPVLGGYAITVTWGAANGVFTKISGSKSDNAVLDQNVSSPGGNPKILKIPGKYACYPVTLQAGYMEQLQAEGPWWKALEQIQSGEIAKAKKPCEILFWDTNKHVVLTVELEDAWPSRWTASDLSIQKSILWVETVIFQCESVKFTWST